jgi:YbbR domain-containing protein
MVSAPAERIRQMREDRVTASVDLSKPVTGVHEYPVSLSPAWVAKYIDGRPTVRLTIEAMDSRTLPITRVEKGVLRDSNLQIFNKRMSPKEVTVRGPESEVATVVVARAFLDLSEIDPLNTQPQEAEVVPLDRRGNRPQHVHTTPNNVVHFFSIGASPSTKVATVVPDLSVTYASNVLPNGYDIDPKTVSLAGRPVDLANVSKVPTETIRITGLAQTRSFKVRLLAPEGTNIVGPPTVSVTVKVRPGPKTTVQPPETTAPPTGNPPTTEPPAAR